MHFTPAALLPAESKMSTLALVAELVHACWTSVLAGSIMWR